jgi:hypothetical protein
MLKKLGEETFMYVTCNIYLTKSGQNVEFMTFMTTTRVSAGRQDSKNKKNNFLFFSQKYEKSKKSKNRLYLVTRQVNPPRSGVYFWTLVCPEVVKCMICISF